jgi:PAS domain S-box-containing protein
MDKIRVLHVDDDPTFGELVTELLPREDERFEVISEGRAATALDRLRSGTERIDCVVSDYEMPEMNGIEFLSAVRQVDSDLPFILFTGKGSEEVASDAIANGATDYLQKSGAVEQFELLANQIENAVNRYQAQQERERVYQALETATQGISILDEDGTYIYVNEAYADLYDRTPAGLRGDGWERLYPEDEVNRFRTEILPSLEAEGSWSGRSTGLRADGTTFAEQLSLTQLDTGGHVCVAQDLSERVTRKRELEQKERRYQAIFDDPNILAGLLTVDGTLKHVNQTALQFVDQDRDDLIGEQFWETPWWNYSAELQENLRDWIHQAGGGEYVKFEAENQTSDGELIQVDGVIRPVTDEDGTVRSLLVTARDITERKETEQQLQAYIDNASDVLGVISEGGVFKELSPSVERVTGYEPETLVGDSVFEYVHPEDRQHVIEKFTKMQSIPEERTARVEYRFKQPDGSWLWLESASKNKTDPHLDGFVITSREITDRKKQEQTLRDQNRKITALHRVASEIEACESPDEVYATVVDAAEDILQLDIAIADAAVGDTLVPRAVSSNVSADQYYNRTPIDADDNFAAQAYRTGESILAQDITEHDISPATDEFRSMLTVPIGKHGVFQTVDLEPEAFDETDRELTELLLSRADARLDQLETEQQLRKQTEKLTRQNERLEEFTSVVSHDLRNPLNLAMTSLELVSDECDSEHVDKVERGHEQMDTLIENLLTLAKEGETVSESDTVDLAALSRDCWETVATGSATLHVEIDASVQAKRSRLRQLLTNLFRNAIEHGGSDVTVRIGELDDGFFVGDDGPGISPEKRNRVFENGYTTADDGTGFGLSIVDDVVTAHGWGIDIAEGTAGGARFEIRDVDILW